LKFDRFIHAADFIVPTKVGAYIIRPYGAGESLKCGTMKGYMRFFKFET
jgi:hypothetical protein